MYSSPFDLNRVRTANSLVDNHKPAQSSESRTTTLTSTSPNAYGLRLEDKSSSGNKDVFTFTGNRVAAKKSYVLLFDPASQKATLEPLSDAYTFNLATQNNKNISSEHEKIYPKKSKDSHQGDEGEDDLFGEAVQEDESGDPDPSNPYDFRHFLGKEKEKRGDESEYHNASSPDDRAGTGSAMNTPQFGARKPVEATALKSKPAEPVQKKRRTAESGMFMKKKPGVKKAQPTPSINIERRATERPAPAPAPKPKAKAAGPPASKIKSAEIVHSSDESDADAEGEPEHVSSPPQPTRRSPSPQYHAASDQDDQDADGDSDDDGGLEIEVPDARPPRPQNGGALKSLGLGQTLGVGRGFKSPSQGPISLASATNSAHGSPNPAAFTPRKSRTQDDNVIDFGDLGGGAEDAEGEDDEEDEEDDDDGELERDEGDHDVEVIDIGPPARQGGHDRKPSMGGVGLAAEEDEEDPLYQEMMAGLAGGDSSEESEEE
jgi:hypothetical protein